MFSHNESQCLAWYAEINWHWWMITLLRKKKLKDRRTRLEWSDYSKFSRTQRNVRKLDNIDRPKKQSSTSEYSSIQNDNLAHKWFLTKFTQSSKTYEILNLKQHLFDMVLNGEYGGVVLNKWFPEHFVLSIKVNTAHCRRWKRSVILGQSKFYEYLLPRA